MSVYSCKSPLENICSRDRRRELFSSEGCELNNFLQVGRRLGLVIIILIKVFGNSTFFSISILPPIVLKR